MNITKKSAALLVGLGLLTGTVVTMGLQTHAQTVATSNISTPATNQPMHMRGHAPAGGDGNVTAINGTSITMQEEADEGGTIYTVDASKVTIPAIKVGDKIFVTGTLNGTNEVATSISVGHPGGMMGHWMKKDSSTSTQQN